MRTSLFLSAAALVAVTGCTTTKPVASSAPPPTPASNAQSTSPKPTDAAPQSAITGVPRPGSKFALLKLGMDMDEVQTVMGSAPTRTDSHETGKRWIPFYFGDDARRLEALYRGDGCLSFTGGNAWGAAGGELVAITNDPSGACFQK